MQTGYTSELLRHYNNVRRRLNTPPVKPKPIPPTLSKEPLIIRLAAPALPVPKPPPPHPCFNPQKFSLDVIVRLMSRLEGISVHGLVSKCRTKALAMPRHRMFFLITQHCRKSIAESARRLGFDHTTILYARDKTLKKMRENVDFCYEMMELEGKLYAAAATPQAAVPAVHEPPVAVITGPCP